MGSATTSRHPIEHFQYSTQIVLTLDNQNNAIKGETISHFRSEYPAVCLVRAGVYIFLRIQEHGCPATTPVSNYPSDKGMCFVGASNIISVIRAKTCQGRAARLGFVSEDVGTRCLHSGRAMDMHIEGGPDCICMAISQWRSKGFMVYIQQQISSFSVGVSVRMGQQPWFRHL